MIDLFLFMGQSNMAGRGIISQKWPEAAPEVIKGAGYEYRAVSDPYQLHIMKEPFGQYENKEGGIHDGNMKTGSLVTAFTNAYFEKTGIPIVGVSASKGGSSILKWQPGGDYLSDTINRKLKAEAFLKEQNIKVRHCYMLWCQGETDGDCRMEKEVYKHYFTCMLDEMIKQGVEHCFLIKIGLYNGEDYIDYEQIRQAQSEIANENEYVSLVSESFVTMKERQLMKDPFHYFQAAYNEVGREAGENVACYTNKIE